MSLSLNEFCARRVATARCCLRPITVALVVMITACVNLVPSPARAQAPVGVAELTPEAEAAIDSGLTYLARQQKGDGGWGGPAETAVVLMAFMLKGYFPDPDQPDRYGEQLDRGVQFLINRSRQHGGYFGGSMYHHALATLALAEAWGMSPRPEIRETLKAAVEVIVRAQHSGGGWRYQPMPVDHDTSVAAMVVVALAAAHEAGILVPRETMQRATDYIKGCQTESGGFGYKSARDPAFPRSAACTLALQLGGERDSDAVRKGLAYLTEASTEDAFGGRHFSYAQYYSMQAMYQAGDSYYHRWYPRIHDLLLQRQRDDGSWHGGHSREFNTGMSILVLGVPYRYLPIYQR